MQGTTLVSVCALALSAGALTFGFLSSTPDSPGASEPGGIHPTATADTELVARIDALTAENRELRERIAMLETRPLAGQRAPAVEGFVPQEDFEAFRDEVRAALEEGPRAKTAATPKFKQDVAQALEAIRHDEAVEKVRAAQEKRTARFDEDVAKIEEWLELSPYQTDQMRSALLAQYDRENEVRRLWEEGADDEVLGQRKQESRDLFRADLEGFLGPDQVETFWERARRGGK